MFETIIALATPPLKSALAIIRLSGDDCFDIVNNVIKKPIKDIKENKLMFSSIYDGDKKIDECVLAIYKGPHSFTGEDSVEIMCHGSMLIANEIITLLIKYGARMALNGEFSSRAFTHGKVDLVQAEAINDLINATNKESKNVSLLALDKKVTNKIMPIKNKIADILSLIAVNIDYPEYEDIEVVNKDTVITKGNNILADINKLLIDSEIAVLIKQGLKVAIIGQPNVGKSSLLNALIGEDKAIVTDIEGTTRDIVEGELVINGVTLHLLDTAGIRETDNKVEHIGVEKSLNSIKEADIVLFVKDARNKMDEKEDELVSKIDKNKLIIVENKGDLIDISEKDTVVISAKNNDIKPLLIALKNKIGVEVDDYKIPALNNARQVGLLKGAKESIIKAISDAKNDVPMDLINYSFISAHNAILEILGETNQTDIIKEVFSRFCLGK